MFFIVILIFIVLIFIFIHPNAHLLPSQGSARLYVKGASEWILKDCSHYLDRTGKLQPLTSQTLAEFERHILSMAENALRTLCLAHRDMRSLPADWQDAPPDNAGLCLDCIVGIIDPLRPDVKEAVRVAQRAGVT